MGRGKRSKDQLERDRTRITTLALQKYTHAEIAELLKEETGIALSRRQITYDMGVIRKRWLAKTHENFEALIHQELDRIDATELAVWEALREQGGERVKSVIKLAGGILMKSAYDEGEEYDGTIQEITKTVEQLAVNPAYFSQIVELQKERRRLLGLYAPREIDIRKTVSIKGYKGISPDDWDVIIEGEILETA